MTVEPNVREPVREVEEGTAAPVGDRGRKLKLPSAQASLLALLGLALVTLPLHASVHLVLLTGSILIFALLFLSVDLLTGLTGLATMGQTAFFGVGAYMAGIVAIHLTSNILVQLLLGVGAASLLALVVGLLAVRTSGTVFLMVSVAIGEIVYIFFDGWDYVGATNGLAGIPAATIAPGIAPMTSPGVVYWWVLVVFGLTTAGVLVLAWSPLGRSMRGVRESEGRLPALGQNPYWVKLAAFVAAGAVAGAAGTAWVAQNRFVSPGDFAFELSVLALLGVAIGGAGTLWGPMVAAAVVVLVRDELGVQLEGRGVLILGVVFVISTYLLPRGIAGMRRTGGKK